MNKILIISILILLYVRSPLSAQVSFATPNASELGKYGQVPVELFNGLPQISVPLYTVKNKDIEVPISLNYHASGIKTEQHPTWTGLGWNLSCGGSITRIVNGTIDELNKADVLKQTGLGFSEPEFGYFNASKYIATAGTSWASLSGFTNFLGTGTVDYKYYLDGEPDEFMINAPGISASFYFYRDAAGSLKIKIKSRDGKQLSVVPSFSLNLVVNFAEYDPNDDNWPLHSSELKQTLNHPFYKFIVTTEDGKKYTFGGNTDAIDFYTSVGSSYGGPFRDTQPSTWYLTEIVSTPNTKVNFSYKREGNPIVANNVISKIYSYLPNSSTGTCQGCNDPNNGLFYIIQNPVYLSSITGSNGININFNTNVSADLPYDVNNTIFRTIFDPTFGNNHNATQTMLNQNFWVKLYEININGNSKIAFNYTENVNERLKLNSVEFKGSSSNLINKYSFTYNTKKLPRYNLKKSDNWGYYNNKTYEGVDFDDLYTYRAPDTSLMKSEILTAIKYPTGGATYFEYEPHSYSKIATQFPLFTLQSSTGFAGGVRIKRITSKDGGTVNPPVIKEYSYLNENNTSSGILSGIPMYSASGRTHVSYSVSSWDGLASWRASADYEQRCAMFSENYINMLGNTNGNHVTYTRVIETTPGFGKVINKYRNHDTFPDTLPVALYTNIDDRTLVDKFTSKELERGLLVSTATYNASNKKVDSTSYEYNSSPSRFNDYVKSIAKSIIPGVAGVSFVRMSANKVYTFYPYLEKKTTLTFGLAGEALTTTAQSFTYSSPENLLKDETITGSKGEEIKISYKYPGNISTGIYPEMFNNHIYSPIVEKTTTVSGTQTDFQKTEYYKPSTGIYVPKEIYQGVSSTTAERRVNYEAYDDFANPLTTSVEKGVKTSYKWGYNKQYPIAEIRNSSLTQFYHQNFEDQILDFDGSISLDNTRSHTGRYSAKISNGSSTELTSHCTTLTPINLTAKKKFIYSGWIYTDNPSAELFLFMRKAGETGYYSYVDNVQTTVKNKWVYLQKEFEVPADVTNIFLRLDNNGVGNVWFDDLRILPSDASMTTYTYTPLVGITSSTDPKGMTTYYEYDNFQRLKNIKDQNGNIIKSYDYQYKP